LAQEWQNEKNPTQGSSTTGTETWGPNLIKLPRTKERECCVCSRRDGKRKRSSTVCRKCDKGLHPDCFEEHSCSRVMVAKK
jgi:hypothetical protein